MGFMVIGFLIGTFFGAMPGLTSVLAVALLLSNNLFDRCHSGSGHVRCNLYGGACMLAVLQQRPSIFPVRLRP